MCAGVYAAGADTVVCSRVGYGGIGLGIDIGFRA